MMVSEEAGTVQEDLTSTEASTQSENQGKVNSDETKSGRPSALGLPDFVSSEFNFPCFSDCVIASVLVTSS